jgi:carbonic anhydrase
VDIIYRFDPHKPLTAPQCPDADAAVDALKRGNRRYVEMADRVRSAAFDGGSNVPLVIPSDALSRGFTVWGNEAPTQAPYALVLGCSDARVPVEVVFDQASNALFTVRIAGNVLGTECLGSIDFAIRNLGKSLKLVVVLGHRNCGAVGAAVDTYMNPGDYSNIAFTHALRSLVERILIAVRGSAKAIERACGRSVSGHPNYRAALVDTAVPVNAALTAFDLRREISHVADQPVRVVWGVYDLVSQRVRAHADDGNEVSPFGDVPAGPDDLAKLADRLAKAAIVSAGLG